MKHPIDEDFHRGTPANRSRKGAAQLKRQTADNRVVGAFED